jgi:hypothetical protein
MKTPSDARFAFLRDPDLYDLVYRVALKIVRDETFAEDIRQGSYVVAMQLVLRKRGPKPDMQRGWMCRVTKNHTFAEIRRRKGEERPLEEDDTPDIPVEDRQTLHEQQMEIERQFEVAEETASKHPKEVAEVIAPDGRSKEGAHAAPKDAAARKRKERARAYLASTMAAAMVAVAAVIFWVRSWPKPHPGLPAGAYATLADASHELAHRSCAEQRWVACLENLEQTRRLDPSKLGPAEQEAWKAAVAGIRAQALADCTKGELMTCLEGLDTARRYDPDGDADPSVQLARSEAQQRLQGSAKSTPPRVPDAKEIPR